jgi:hypothetical protein
MICACRDKLVVLNIEQNELQMGNEPLGMGWVIRDYQRLKY